MGGWDKFVTLRKPLRGPLRGEKVGTRCEIYLRRRWDEGYYEVVELWKDWDGYPEHMLPFLRRFASFASECVGDQRHWLTYPTDMAAMLIAFDYEERRLRGDEYLRPDVRPRGDIRDAEYAYVIDLSGERVGEIYVTCYRIYGGEGLKDWDRMELRERRSLSDSGRLDKMKTVRIGMR